MLKGGDAQYRRYVDAQLGHLRSVRSMTSDVGWKHRLAIPKLADYFRQRGANLADVSVLCVGCRLGAELDAFEAAGFGRVTGIDLYSVDPARIHIMDMHAMTFPDASFDVIFSADNLEHAYDVRVVLDQMLRVARPQAAFCIMTPVQFDTNDRHPTDVRSFDHLKALIGPPYAGAIYEEMRHSKKGQPYMVSIFGITKPAAGAAAERSER
jgi:SAM-dependent methyltransferase